jgi:hypothetical protein
MGGDNAAIMKFEQMKDEYLNEASLSKQARDQFKQVSGKLVGKKLEDYEGVEDFQKWMSTPGDYQFKGQVGEKFKPKPMEELFKGWIGEAMKTATANRDKNTITDPDGSTTTIGVSEFTKDDSDLLLERVRQDPVTWRHVQSNFESLPQEEQEKYNGDAIEWTKDKYGDQLLISSEQTVDKAAKKKGLGDLAFGNGFAENKYYRFDYQKKPGGGEESALGPVKGTHGVDEQIDFSGKRAGEIDKITFIEPGGDKEIEGRPVKLEKKSDGSWNIVVSTKNRYGSKISKIPYDKYSGELKKFGFDLEEFLLGVEGGETTQTTGFGEGEKKPTIDMSDIFK